MNNDNESSLASAYAIAVRPFTEDLEGSWRAVKGICLASLVVTICFWLASSLVSSPSAARAVTILNTVGWFTAVVFIFCYATIYWEIHLRDQDKEAEKVKKIKGFTDVEKKH